MSIDKLKSIAENEFAIYNNSDHVDKLRQALNAAIKVIEVQDKALEFYGEQKNWYSSYDNEEIECMEINDDDGYRDSDKNNMLFGGLRARQARQDAEEIMRGVEGESLLYEC